jgi:hypothetical protein
MNKTLRTAMVPAGVFICLALYLWVLLLRFFG